MAEIVDYMSWNVEQFSKRHAEKNTFRNVNVAFWIATLIREMQANLLGIMEVSMASGGDAVALVKDRLNAIEKAAGTSKSWTSVVSDRSVPTTSPFATRADKYALIWDKSNVTVSNPAIIDASAYAGVSFLDRVPLYWITKAIIGKKSVNCLLWHAPQPKYHKKTATIQEIATLATQILTNTGNNMGLISGDFNYDTDSTAAYLPLTSLGFTGVFNGDLTTLTSFKSFMADIANRKKMVAQGDYDEAFLANAFDNIFLKSLTGTFDEKVCLPYVICEEIMTSLSFSMVTRSELQTAMQQAKIISDHMPLVITVSG